VLIIAVGWNEVYWVVLRLAQKKERKD
jgi:hypothetical protein